MQYVQEFGDLVSVLKQQKIEVTPEKVLEIKKDISAVRKKYGSCRIIPGSFVSFDDNDKVPVLTIDTGPVYLADELIGDYYAGVQVDIQPNYFDAYSHIRFRRKDQTERAHVTDGRIYHPHTTSSHRICAGNWNNLFRRAYKDQDFLTFIDMLHAFFHTCKTTSGYKSRLNQALPGKGCHECGFRVTGKQLEQDTTCKKCKRFYCPGCGIFDYDGKFICISCDK